MKRKNQVEIEIGGQTLLCDFDYSPGDPGVTSGPVESCYEPEPEEFSVTCVKLFLGFEKSGLKNYLDITDLVEDFDGFEDGDFCAELDNDADGLEDSADACANDPEDMDGFADDDGCPDPDNDKDNILDADDRCPNEAEDVDGYDDTDGCPDPDNDDDDMFLSSSSSLC